MRQHVIAVVPFLLSVLAVTDAVAQGSAFKVAPKPTSGGAAAAPVRRVEDDRGPAKVEDDSDIAEIKQVRAGIATYDSKLKTVLAADSRVPLLKKQVSEAFSIKDKVERKKKLTALAPQIADVRNDAIKKSGFDAKEIEKKVATLSSSRSFSIKTRSAPPAGANSVTSTIETTSFSKSYSYKNDCPDKGDSWDFSGNKVSVSAISTVADDDCWAIRAGKTATVQVPKGAKKVKIVLKAKVDLDVSAMSFGVFGEAAGYVGLFLFSTGSTFDTLKLGNKKFPVPAKLYKLKTIHAKNSFPNAVPVDTDSFDDDLKEGDDAATLTLDLPDDIGSTLEISPVIGGWVDADLSGAAKLDNDMTVKGLKVTFYR